MGCWWNFLVLKSVPASCTVQLLKKRIRSKKFHQQHGEPDTPDSGQWAKILSEPKVRKYESTLCRLAFEDHCELCDAVQRVHGNAGEAGLGPLASEPRKCRNAVGGLGKTLEERPERRTWCDTLPSTCSSSSTSKARSRRLLTMCCEGAL